MKTKRLFTALMMATMMSCGIILAQPCQKDKRLTPEQRIEMQVKKAQQRLLLDEATAAKFAPLYKEYLEAMQQCKPTCIIRKSKFPQNPKRSVRFSGKRTKRSVQKRKARNTQKAETKVL